MLKQIVSSKRNLFLSLIVIVLLAGGIVIFLGNKPSRPTSGQIKTIDSPSIVNPADKNTLTGNNPNQASPDKSSSAGVQRGTSGDLSAPSGIFISNHRPGQNGSGLVEASQCITTPAAKCYIKFTQKDVVKTLPTRTVDSEGSVFWEWNIKEAGLTNGSWTVTAVASLGNQTKSTTDSLTLEVQ
jgi:hypothetical protein